ncbi:hypothetical protein Tco_1464485, partial [Tanacetum coccineum]
MVAFLEKSTGSAGFHQIIDFINRSHICYALTKKPEVCVSFIKQFWRSAEILTDENGNVKIHATIDGHSLSITEGSLRRHLKLDDQDGIISLPDKLTFQKGAFSPQWRFLIHTILHCLSPKKTAWEQFSSNIAAAVICFDVFSNMKRITKSFSGQEVALFPNMLVVPTPSASPSNSLSSSEPTPSQPSPTQPSPQPSQPSPTPPGLEYHPDQPDDQKDKHSEDPFGLYPLLNKENI